MEFILQVSIDEHGASFIERSNSAKTPHIWKSALPAGVVVSIPC